MSAYGRKYPGSGSVIDGPQRHGKLEPHPNREPQQIGSWTVEFLRGSNSRALFIQITGGSGPLRLLAADVDAIVLRLAAMGVWRWVDDNDRALGWTFHAERAEPTDPASLEDDGWWQLVMQEGLRVYVRLRSKRISDPANLPARVLLDLWHERPPGIRAIAPPSAAQNPIVAVASDLPEDDDAVEQDVRLLRVIHDEDLRSTRGEVAILRWAALEEDGETLLRLRGHLDDLLVDETRAAALMAVLRSAFPQLR